MDAEALTRRRRDGAACEALLARIAAHYDELPRQLKSVAKYVEEHRASLMVDRTGDIAARCGVQPSAVVRFAQRFGFSGFTGDAGGVPRRLPRAGEPAVDLSRSGSAR